MVTECYKGVAEMKWQVHGLSGLSLAYLRKQTVGKVLDDLPRRPEYG